MDFSCRQEYSLAKACAWNVNQPELNPPQTHHVCLGHFYFSELWQAQQTSMTAKRGVPAEDTDKLPFLQYPWPCLFVFPFLITETMVNYWLTWVLITMQIWVRIKSKAASSCHTGFRENRDCSQGCATALWWKLRDFLPLRSKNWLYYETSFPNNFENKSNWTAPTRYNLACTAVLRMEGQTSSKWTAELVLGLWFVITCSWCMKRKRGHIFAFFHTKSCERVTLIWI